LLGAIALSAVMLIVFRTAWPKISRNLFLSVAAGLAIAFAVSASQHFQVLGRHLAAFLPLMLLPVMLFPRGLSRSSWHSRKLAIAVIALGAVWIISDLRLVFLTKYQKDSYREACLLALARAQNDGASILWVAEPVTARYYGLTVTPLTESASAESSDEIGWVPLGRAIDGRSWSLDQAESYLRSSTSPVIVVLSKPETSDPNRAWTSLIDSSSFTPLAKFNAFAVFEWQPDRDSI